MIHSEGLHLKIPSTYKKARDPWFVLHSLGLALCPSLRVSSTPAFTLQSIPVCISKYMLTLTVANEKAQFGLFSCALSTTTATAVVG